MTAALVLVLGASCMDSEQETPVASEPLARAGFEMTAVIQGPVSSDDDADMEVTLRETAGVAARINFLRLTCSNGAMREWGASSFASELGSNRIAARQELVFVRHYVCPNSSRPRELLADLTDENGFHHQLISAPFHPDWPGA